MEYDKKQVDIDNIKVKPITKSNINIGVRTLLQLNLKKERMIK
ncbi:MULTISPECIES: hypothetical protein [Paenibacillus]|nr:MULTISPECIES: hypothetical protein [Paenibacillus]